MHVHLSAQCIAEATLAAMFALCVRAELEARETTETMLLTCASQPAPAVLCNAWRHTEPRFWISQDAMVPRRHGLQVSSALDLHHELQRGRSSKKRGYAMADTAATRVSLTATCRHTQQHRTVSDGAQYCAKASGCCSR